MARAPDRYGTGETRGIFSTASMMFWTFMGVESISVAGGAVDDGIVPRADRRPYRRCCCVLSTMAIMDILPNGELRHSTEPRGE
jgi:arginine:agmatine antiporter